jgi:hypothetical protein
MFYNEASRSHGEHWLKTLAQSDAHNGAIVPKNPAELGESSRVVLAHVLDDLLDDLLVAVCTFNDYRAGRDKLSLVESRQDGCHDGPVEEIGLLLSGRQARVRRDGLSLIVTVSVRRLWQIRAVATRRFTPEPDGMGGVWWRMNGGLLMERPTLVKYLLSDLVRVTG